jgi:hypothetical protein
MSIFVGLEIFKLLYSRAGAKAGVALKFYLESHKNDAAPQHRIEVLDHEAQMFWNPISL